MCCDCGDSTSFEAELSGESESEESPQSTPREHFIFAEMCWEMSHPTEHFSFLFFTNFFLKIVDQGHGLLNNE